MRYELEKGSRDSRECSVRAYSDEYDHLATYTGHYDRKSCTWILFRKKVFGGVILPYKLLLSENEVRPKSKPMPMHADRKPAPKKAKTEEKPKTRAWWKLPPPDGQMKL